MSDPGMDSEVAGTVDALRPTVERICADVWRLAEPSLQEVESAKVHITELESAGFRVVSRGTAGVPTAFIAEWGQGEDGPVVGFLPEYDALPGLGNGPVPRQEARSDGVTSGHACGHNLLGAGLTGAAIAAKRVAQAREIPGTLRVYGCASEETEGAKIYMAREGLFDDLDACLHWHPAPVAAVANIRLASVSMMKIEFHGQTAHAGLEPWKGRSALDAMELTAHGLNLMREHLEPTARVQYIFEVAGEAPNIVPGYARMFLTLRDVDRTRVVATTEWVKQIVQGAALGTQTTANVAVYCGMHDLLPNGPLAARMQTHIERVGTPGWTEDEQAFARECQHQLGVDETGLATSVLALLDEPTLGGASDVAEASWNAPTMGIAMPTMPLGVSLHTWAVTACAGMSIGVKGAVAATKVLAHTALDVLTDTDLRAAARADFEGRTNAFTYTSPLPADQQHPLDLPPWLITDGSTEAMAALERGR